MSTTRRTLLAGFAALPLASAAPVVALASTLPDPVFAAIEAHRAAWDAYSEACAKTAPFVPGDEPEGLEEARDAAMDVERDILWDLVHTVPQTLAGLRAMIEYLGEKSREADGDPHDIGDAFPAIVEACVALLPAPVKGGDA